MSRSSRRFYRVCKALGGHTDSNKSAPSWLIGSLYYKSQRLLSPLEGHIPICMMDGDFSYNRTPVRFGGKSFSLLLKHIFGQHCFAGVWTIKVGVGSQEFKLIRYRGFGGDGFRGVICLLSVRWGFEWMSSTVHRGRAVRKFGRCESKLKVLSCQPGIRQRGGCNELSVCVCVCVWVLFRERERKGCFWLCVLQSGHVFSFSPSRLSPSISSTHTWTHILCTHGHTGYSNTHFNKNKASYQTQQIYQAWLLQRGFVTSLIPENTESMNTITSHAKLHFLLVYSGVLHSSWG